MLPLILAGGAAFIAYKALSKPGVTGQTELARSRAPISGFAGTVEMVPGRAGGVQGAASGAHQIAGNANQPWYNGALVTGAGIGATALIKALGSAFDDTDGDNGPDVDDTDLEDSSDEMALSNEGSTFEDEEPWDDESYGDDGETFGDDGGDWV